MTDTILEQKQEQDPRMVVGYGVDEKGFFKCSIHVDRGLREILGFLEQCKDLVKQYYAAKLLEQQKEQKLVRPDHGFLRSFKNRWKP